MTRFFMAVSKAFAVLGGVVLTAIVLITCLSIIGRTLNTVLHSSFMQERLSGMATWLIDTGIGPIKGDFELVEAMMAFAIFAFLPLTQMTNGHASVDIFTARLGPGAQRVLRMIIEMLFAVALVVITFQLYVGMGSKMRSGQTTFLLEFPIWWAYAASLVPAVVAAVVAVYMALVRMAEMAIGKTLIADEMGAEH